MLIGGATFGSLFVFFGLPLILFLVLFGYACWRVQFRLTRIKWWLISSDQADRFHVTHLFKNLANHPKNGDPPFVNWYYDAATWVWIGLSFTCFISVFMLILCFGIALILLYHPPAVGSCFVSLAFATISLVYGTFAWKMNEWRAESPTLISFGVSAICLLVSLFLVIFLSDNTLFWGISIVFLTLNYLFIMELVSRNESWQRVTPKDFLRDATGSSSSLLSIAATCSTESSSFVEKILKHYQQVGSRAAAAIAVSSSTADSSTAPSPAAGTTSATIPLIVSARADAAAANPAE